MDSAIMENLDVKKYLLIGMFIALCLFIAVKAKALISGIFDWLSLSSEIEKDDLSYDKYQYITWANTLESAMKGLGTDDDTVKDVFGAMVTKSDVLYLIRTYGTRDGEDLAKWLNGDGCTKYVNKILEGKGIDYRF